MITLAIAAAFFYLTLQNWPIFNGFAGFTTIPAPVAFGINWKHPVPLYYLILFFAALSYVAVVYISRAPFGLALQGVRDNPRRMEAIGYNVTAHRIAAFAFAALIASIGGILMVWLNNQISPGSIGIEATIDLLVIAVVGGLGHPIGAFVGAIIYVILRTFALDALVAVGLDGRRFQTLIGLGFLVIVLFSPDGVIGLWRRWVARARASDGRTNALSSIAERMAAAGTGNAIELRGVSRFFGALAALIDITLSVRPGERRAVLGSNGAGKTTLLNCVTGDFPPTSGSVRFFGEDVTTLPPHERIRRGLRRTYQISLLFPHLTVRENVYLALPRRFARPFLVHPHAARATPSCSRSAISSLSFTSKRLPIVSSANWRTASSASSKLRWHSPARRASFCSTSRRRACRRTSGATWSRSSARFRPISATSSLSTTWTWRCASSRA